MLQPWGKTRSGSPLTPVLWLTAQTTPLFHFSSLSFAPPAFILTCPLFMSFPSGIVSWICIGPNLTLFEIYINSEFLLNVWISFDFFSIFTTSKYPSLHRTHTHLTTHMDTHLNTQTNRSLRFLNPELVFMLLVFSLPFWSECDPFEVLANFTAPWNHILSLITGPKMICIASHPEI